MTAVYLPSIEELPTLTVLQTHTQMEQAWWEYVSVGANATFTKDADEPFHGFTSQQITMTAPTGPCDGDGSDDDDDDASATRPSSSTGCIAAVENRGLGSEGLFIEASRLYRGYFFAKSEQPVSLIARLIDTRTNKSLATQRLSFAGACFSRVRVCHPVCFCPDT